MGRNPAFITRTILLIFYILTSTHFILIRQSTFIISKVAAQSNPTPKVEMAEPKIEEGNPPPPSVSSRSRFLSSFEGIISILVSIIGFIALMMEFMLLRKIQKLKAEDTLRVYAVTLIVIGTLFFVTAGFDANHVAPAMGLFGTVAGYLLGRSVDRRDEKDID